MRPARIVKRVIPWWETPIKILVDAPAWVGDMVMAQALFTVLKQQYPSTRIDVLAPRWSREVLLRMPEVTHMWPSPGGHGEFAWRARYRLARQLRAEQYDWAIVLRNSWKSALVPYWAHIPRRTGWLGEWRFGLLNDWRRLDTARWPKMVDRFCALAWPEGHTPTQATPRPQLLVDETSIQATLVALGLVRPHAPLLVLCPGAAYGPAKCWPVAHFAEVAQQQLAKGWEVWLLGSAQDQAATAAIQAGTAGRCVDLAGKTSLSQTIDCLALATQVVSNDSGLMHIAAAVGAPLVVLYGSTSPAFTPPLTDRVTLLSLQLACSPCFKRVCPLGHTDCLQKLTPQHVLAAME